MNRNPTEEEVAAIAAAVELLWPRPAEVQQPAGPPPWRFSGRWWTAPATVRRPRPWVAERS